MATIDLSATEAVVLHEVMQISLSELRSEISHTDDRAFKTALNPAILSQKAFESEPVTLPLYIYTHVQNRS